jgi:arabinan endo-1,5-alpha-L-arabinosidase
MMFSSIAMAVLTFSPPALPTEEISSFPFDGIALPGGDSHDPSIAYLTGKYFCTVTSGNSFAPIKSSSDMRSWKDEGPALATAPEWLKAAIPAHRSVWAPALVQVGDIVRLYYCASEKFGSNTSYIGVAENRNFRPDQPTEGWVDAGVILNSTAGTDNFNAIDPDVLVGPDGRNWMVYGSYWSGIYLTELNPTTGLRRSPTEAPLAVASNTGERGNPLEAPALAFHDGYCYLFVTYGLAAQGVRSSYRMMVGRSKTPTGPYLGYDEKPMTEGGHTEVLKSSPPMFGPGGGNVFRGADGDLYMTYHYYDARRYWTPDTWGRPTMQIRKVTWGKDGWPLPGLPIGAEPKDSGKNPIGKWVHQADFSQPESVELREDGSIIHLGNTKANGKWLLTGDQLVMTWPREDRPTEPFVDTLTLDSRGGYYVGRNQAGRVIRGVRASADIQ